MTTEKHTAVDELKALLSEIGNIANGIRARDGAPAGYSHDYFNELVDRIHAACDGDCLTYSWKAKKQVDELQTIELEQIFQGKASRIKIFNARVVSPPKQQPTTDTQQAQPIYGVSPAMAAVQAVRDAQPDKAECLEADLNELIRVALTNPSDLNGFIKANYPREYAEHAAAQPDKAEAIREKMALSDKAVMLGIETVIRVDDAFDIVKPYLAALPQRNLVEELEWLKICLEKYPGEKSGAVRAALDFINERLAKAAQAKQHKQRRMSDA